MDGLGKFYISNKVQGTLRQLVLDHTLGSEELACCHGPSHGISLEIQP